MRQVLEKDVFGRPVTMLVPENDEDLETLREAEKKGEFDSNEAFGDSPESIPLEEQ